MGGYNNWVPYCVIWVYVLRVLQAVACTVVRLWTQADTVVRLWTQADTVVRLWTQADTVVRLWTQADTGWDSEHELWVNRRHGTCVNMRHGTWVNMRHGTCVNMRHGTWVNMRYSYTVFRWQLQLGLSLAAVTFWHPPDLNVSLWVCAVCWADSPSCLHPRTHECSAALASLHQLGMDRSVTMKEWMMHDTQNTLG